MENRILLADDHHLVRQALRRVVEAQPGMTVVAEASDGREAVELTLQLRPHVAVLDVWMPRLSGIEATREIAKSGCGTRVLILTVHEGQSQVRAALRAGASGYVVKSATSKELIEALECLRAGRSYLSPGIAHHVIDAVNAPDESSLLISLLTDREREVLQLIAEGFSSKEIASELHISPKTAEAHRANLMGKLGIHKTSGLVRFAIREGMIPP